MNKHMKAYNEAQARAERCREWLKQFMLPGQPRTSTKDQLFQQALKVMPLTRKSFDMAWVWAIEEMGRQDWYEPMRQRKPKFNS